MNKFTENFINFKNPVELLVFYDHNFLDELYKLYPWQVDILERFSLDIPLDDMIRIAVIAANGSGKSQFILAPCAAWMGVSFDNSLSYVTSSSASQLDTQTERFLDAFAGKMNKFHAGDYEGVDGIWKIIKRQKVFHPTSSHIDLFATDEPKRAEGKHPLVPGGEFAIFVDEGKSIAEDIYGAIDRCTGATRRLDISSAGGCHGHFYDVCTKQELGWWVKKIIYKDCPHIRESEAQQLILKHGLNDPLIRSILFSEFTSIDDSIIITRESWTKCKKLFDETRISKKLGRRMGVDLSAGGDETAGSIFDGNIQIGLETCRFSDTAQGAKEVISWMEKWQVKPENVWIEYDGFNRGVVDNIVDRGYKFNKVISGGSALDKGRYSNRITELWFTFKRYVEEGYVSLLDDQQLREQFCNRYYKRAGNQNKIILESKKEARANGHPSPDRADATVFAWAACPTIDVFLNDYINVKEVKENKYGQRVTKEQMEEIIDQWAYGDKPFFNPRFSMKRGHVKKVYNNVDAVKSIEQLNNPEYYANY